MPPTRTEFEQYFAAFSKRLSEAIKGRESSPEGVKPTRKDDREVAISLRHVPVNTPEGMFDFSFEIHGDCPCSAINSFLLNATIDNLTFARGPRGGKVLGINGEAIKSFYAYKT